MILQRTDPSGYSRRRGILVPDVAPDLWRLPPCHRRLRYECALSNAQTPVVGATATIGTTSTAVFGSNVTAGNLIVVFSVSPANVTQTVSSVTDSLSNTYTSAIGPIDQATLLYRVYIHYAKNIAGGACTVTTTWDPADILKVTTVYEIAGADTATPLVDTASSTGTGTAMNGGNLDPTQANSALIAFGGTSTGTVAAGTGWTRDLQTSHFWYEAYESRFPTSAAAYAADFSAPNPATNWIVVAAAFQEAAASGRIMSKLAGAGGLAHHGGIAGAGGGLAG